MTGEKMPCDLWWTAVRHPSSAEPLYLVRARVKKGVMYLITNDPVKTEEQAWEVFFSYRRRWQIELSFRYATCELALECPRFWSLEARLKLRGPGSCWSMPFCFSCSIPCIMNSLKLSYASNATEPESDASRHRHRFIGFDGRSVGFGTITVPA
jgi:hypothetical protein